MFVCPLLFQSNNILLVEFCPKVFRNYHMKPGRRDFRGRGLYSVTKQGLKNWQQCSLTISAQDWFLNRWQPLWKIQVQFLVKMRSRLGMRWEQNTQPPFKKLDFSSSQLVMKLLFSKEKVSLLCCRRSLVGSNDRKWSVFAPIYSVLHFVVHSADDSYSFISFL